MSSAKNWPVSIALTFFFFLSAPAQATQSCHNLINSKQKVDDSTPAGILMHGEHWVDLILAQGSTKDRRHLKAFREITETLITAARSGGFHQVNEKIDGSPSIVVGFTAKEQPFVAYKGHFSKKTGQSLVTAETDLEIAFKRSEGLKQIFSVLRDELNAAMGAKMTSFHDFIFQGDLLFIEGDDRRIIENDKVVIQANAIPYEIGADHPYFNDLRMAKVGIVFHSIGRRVLQNDGTLQTEAVDNDPVLRNFVSRLREKNIFVIDPFKDQVKIAQEKEFTAQGEASVRKLLIDIEQRIDSLNPEFIKLWNTKFEAKWRIFFNSGLHHPNTGGVYREIAEGRDVDLNVVFSEFTNWIIQREEAGKEKSLTEAFKALVSQHEASLKSILQAYFNAIRVQYLLQPSLNEAFASKLGGGPSEGLMLKTTDTIVKLVDRLDFTLLNNQRWNRGGGRARPLKELRAPFNIWNPDAVYTILKGQPVHGGHIEMIKQAVRQNPGKRIKIILSDKSPNLEATTREAFGVSGTKKELIAKEYTYIFSAEFRRSILELGLKKLPVDILIEDPYYFWIHLRSAKAAGHLGKVQLIVGEKELREGRYNSQVQELGEVFQLQSIDMQLDEVSGTAVRGLLHRAALGTADERAQAMASLDQVYRFIPAKTTRHRMIQQMILEWKKVDAVAVKITTPAPRAAKPAKKRAAKKTAA